MGSSSTHLHALRCMSDLISANIYCHGIHLRFSRGSQELILVHVQVLSSSSSSSGFRISGIKDMSRGMWYLPNEGLATLGHCAKRLRAAREVAAPRLVPPGEHVGSVRPLCRRLACAWLLAQTKALSASCPGHVLVGKGGFCKAPAREVSNSFSNTFANQHSVLWCHR